MPDLGKYAFDVLAAYGVSAVFLLALVGHSAWRSARMKRRLSETEARATKNRGQRD
ncbi:MAG: heme exporter protein CcmD [Pseudomonadota bacterium]